MPESDKARWIKYFIPAYLYAVLIFILSSIPLAVPSVAGTLTDKWLHLIEYFIFGFLLARAFKNTKISVFQKQHLMFAIAVGSLYGLSDEYHQLFVRYRCFEPLDVVANIAGTCLGAFIYTALCRRKI